MEDMICSNDWPIFEKKKKKNLVPNFRPEKKKLETFVLNDFDRAGFPPPLRFITFREVFSVCLL